MADLWDQLVKKYPRYTIAILLVYALLVSAYTIYSSVRSYYIELKKPYLEDLAEACGNISEIVARISRSEAYPTDKVEDFWSYYWGRLVLFEDSNLVSKMPIRTSSRPSIRPIIRSASCNSSGRHMKSPALAAT
jgi:hypothetical protein